jgi:hypothetical protein
VLLPCCTANWPPDWAKAAVEARTTKLAIAIVFMEVSPLEIGGSLALRRASGKPARG